MGKVRLKICGLRDNIQEVAALRPDYAGFIFYPKSPRFVGEEFEMPRLEAGVNKVGVFVNEPVKKIMAMEQRHDLQYVQLHGNESVEECELLRNEGIGIIKAFPMDEYFDFDRLKPFASVVDYYLFDTKTKGYGGSGKVFNWEILNEYKLNNHYFLSGGLSLENLDGLKHIDLKKVQALDVNSRFEVRPGLKDIRLLNELLKKLE